MRRSSFLLPALIALSLSACAPTALVNTAASAAQQSAATYQSMGGVFVLANDGVPASGIVLVLDGVSSTDPRCKTTPDKITACRLGSLPANGRSAALAYTGKIVSGSVSWRTPDGKLRGLFVLASR